MDDLRQASLGAVLARNRIIPAVKDEAGLQRALQSVHDVVFMLHGDILTLDGHVHRLVRSGRMPFVHLDMISGLASNPVVLDYFFKHFQRDCGVITTRPVLVRRALDLGIRVIQRYFLLDSLSLQSALEGVAKVRPDAIEVMPGIIPRLIPEVAAAAQVPVIAGGLIRTPGDVEQVLAGGAVAVSTSRAELWVPEGAGRVS